MLEQVSRLMASCHRTWQTESSRGLSKVSLFLASSALESRMVQCVFSRTSCSILSHQQLLSTRRFNTAVCSSVSTWRTWRRCDWRTQRAASLASSPTRTLWSTSMNSVNCSGPYCTSQRRLLSLEAGSNSTTGAYNTDRLVSIIVSQEVLSSYIVYWSVKNVERCSNNTLIATARYRMLLHGVDANVYTLVRNCTIHIHTP